MSELAKKLAKKLTTTLQDIETAAYSNDALSLVKPRFIKHYPISPYISEQTATELNQLLPTLHNKCCTNNSGICRHSSDCILASRLTTDSPIWSGIDRTINVARTIELDESFEYKHVLGIHYQRPYYVLKKIIQPSDDYQCINHLNDHRRPITLTGGSTTDLLNIKDKAQNSIVFNQSIASGTTATLDHTRQISATVLKGKDQSLKALLKGAKDLLVTLYWPKTILPSKEVLNIALFDKASNPSCNSITIEYSIANIPANSLPIYFDLLFSKFENLISLEPVAYILYQDGKRELINIGKTVQVKISRGFSYE